MSVNLKKQLGSDRIFFNVENDMADKVNEYVYNVLKFELTIKLNPTDILINNMRYDVLRTVDRDKPI